MSDVPERPGRVRGSTRSVGVLGWPVDHSLSPAIHNAAFVALGLDWVYVPLPVSPAGLPAALGGLGALGFAGANVTIVVGANGLAGHNSDAAGFELFLRDDVGFDASGRSALLFGAGGGARACALAAARSGLANLSVAVREASRADDLRAALEGSATAVHVVGFDDAPGVGADLIVNATPLGVHGEELPLPSLHAGVVGVDLLYRPGATLFQTAVRDAGGAAFGGLGLLLQQAAISFELWTGRSAPLPVMSAAALAELAESGPAAPGATGTV